MRRNSFIYSLFIAAAVFCTSALNAQAAQPKEWTFLVFLNGNNSLDSFGTTNLKQMEKIGSTDQVNIVVQWASLSTGKIKRLLVQKSTNSSQVTSPVVQEVDGTDMGDWHNVVDFVKWGAANYPAKHYFLDIWDHGSGWHGKKAPNGAREISLDETTGHMITTLQLGQAIEQSASAIGQKIDIYGSDACLMAMGEIADEMADSVTVYAGSEETEPGAGWPYDAFLARFTAKPTAPATEIATMLSEEYAKSYQKGYQQVTFSAFDMSKLPAFKQAITSFAGSMKKMNAATAKKVVAAAKKSQNFTNSDYVDFLDFLKNMNSSSITALDQGEMSAMTSATKNFIITSNNVRYPKATGLSLWIPQSSSTLSQYMSTYQQLKFDQETHWSDFLTAMVK